MKKSDAISLFVFAVQVALVYGYVEGTWLQIAILACTAIGVWYATDD